MNEKSSLAAICKKYGLPTPECKAILLSEGIIAEDGQITPKGFKCNLELRQGQYGNYIVYPEEGVSAFLQKKLGERQQAGISTSENGKKYRAHAAITERQVELLFNGGETLSAIAALAGVTEATIEGKICSCIRKGTIPVEKIVSKERGQQILSAIQSIPDWNGRLKPVKEALGEEYSYFDIRAALSDSKVRAWLEKKGYPVPNDQ